MTSTSAPSSPGDDSTSPSSSIDRAANTSTTSHDAADGASTTPESPRRPSSIRFSADLSFSPRAAGSAIAPRTGASFDRRPTSPTAYSPPPSPRTASAGESQSRILSKSLGISISRLPGPLINMGNTNSQMLDEIVRTSNFDREEVDRLRKRFMKLDKDQSGALDRSEFLSLPSISTNPLATRLIAILDTDGDQTIDFKEFILGLSAFSSKGNKEEKLRFAFKVYDIDRDGYISNGELFLVLKMMVGSNLKDAQLQQICDKTIMEADQDGDGKISFEEFTKVVEGSDVSMSLTLDQF